MRWTLSKLVFKKVLQWLYYTLQIQLYLSDTLSCLRSFKRSNKFRWQILFDFKERNNKTKFRIVYLYVWALLSWILRQLQVKPEVKRSHFWTVFVKGYFSSSSWLFHIVVDIIISDRNLFDERAKDILFLMDNEETC